MNRKNISEFVSVDEAREWVRGADEDGREIVFGECPITGNDVVEDGDGNSNVLLYNGVYFDGDNVSRPRLCEHCSEWFDADSEGVQTVDTGNFFCDECTCETYVCDNCGDYYEYDDDLTRIDDEYYCDECRDRLFVRCDDCGEYFREGNGYDVEGGEVVCESCYENHYFTCDRCGRVLHTDRYACDGLCEDCSNGGHGIHKVLCYHGGRKRDLYRPRTIGNGKEKEPGLLFGVELECERGVFDDGPVASWIDDDNLIHFEHDGSLEGGVELITQPCSLEFHQHKMRWPDLCSEMIGMDFRSHYADNCGLHVHITRGALPPSTIVKMDVLLNRYNYSFWRYIARRSSSHYATADDSRRADVKAGYFSCYDMPPKFREALSKRGKDECFSWKDAYRYGVLNLTNRDTVEIRMAKGTLNPETVLGTIEVYHALTQFAPTLSWTDLYKPYVLRNKFIPYVESHAERYICALPMMKRLMTRAGFFRGAAEQYGEE